MKVFEIIALSSWAVMLLIFFFSVFVYVVLENDKLTDVLMKVTVVIACVSLLSLLPVIGSEIWRG